MHQIEQEDNVAALPISLDNSCLGMHRITRLQYWFQPLTIQCLVRSSTYACLFNGLQLIVLQVQCSQKATTDPVLFAPIRMYFIYDCGAAAHVDISVRLVKSCTTADDQRDVASYIYNCNHCARPCTVCTQPSTAEALCTCQLPTLFRAVVCQQRQ